MTRRRRTVVLGVTVVTMAAVAVGALRAGRTGAGGHDRRNGRPAASVPVVINAVPSAVVAVRVKSGSALVAADRTAGGWQARTGTTAASAAVLGEREGDLFPLRAYRMLATEATRADYGLAAPELTAEVDQGAGRTDTVAIGAATFNGEGFYARRLGDPHLYLLTRRAVDGFRSVLRGEPVTTPRPGSDRERLATAEQLSDPELTTNPWLAQILAETGP